MCLGELPDSNHESFDGNRSRLIQESMERMDRLNMIINKVKEVREQRLTLFSRLKDEMERDDGSDVLRDERLESEVDVIAKLKKKLDGRYGKLVRITHEFMLNM